MSDCQATPAGSSARMAVVQSTPKTTNPKTTLPTLMFATPPNVGDQGAPPGGHPPLARPDATGHAQPRLAGKSGSSPSVVIGGRTATVRRIRNPRREKATQAAARRGILTIREVAWDFGPDHVGIGRAIDTSHTRVGARSRRRGVGARSRRWDDSGTVAPRRECSRHPNVASRITAYSPRSALSAQLATHPERKTTDDTDGTDEQERNPEMSRPSRRAARTAMA